MSSQHIVEVVPLFMQPHPNAEALSLVTVNGYQLVVRTEDWQGITKAAHVLPDNVVDVTREEFSWLRRKDETEVRVKPCRLRGELSMGILVKIPDHFQIGDDVTEYLGVKPYEPELELTTAGNAVRGPDNFRFVSKYDVDSARKESNCKVFDDLEQVWVSEKLHGANMAVTFYEDQFHVRSRKEWKEKADGCIFWKALEGNPQLQNMAKDHPEWLIYGECYGKVKGFPYDTEQLPKFRAFDIRLQTGEFLNSQDFLEVCDKYNLDTVPSLGLHIFHLPTLLKMAERQSAIGDHMAEGIVIKGLVETYHPKIGRNCLKIVSMQYLEK